jgi:hypothetical protein
VKIKNINISFGAFSIVVLMTLHSTDAVAGDSINDSSQTSVKHKKANLRFTGRVHSLGLFGFGGLIANENPAVDLTAYYERKKWGVLLLKAVDLYDIHSPYDFTLGLFYTTLKISPRLTIIPYTGFALEQTHKFAGHGSDALSIITTTYRFDKSFAIEYTTRLSNVMVETEMFDWLNRIRFSWSKDPIDLMLTGWHNNRVFDQDEYTTIGLNAAYSRIKVSDHVTISTGVTALVMADAKNIEASERRNGLLLTIATTVD